MTEDEKQAVVTAIHEGILAAYNMLQCEGEDPFHETMAMAHAAIASLESVGFKVVRSS
jgi:hypothetical protein